MTKLAFSGVDQNPATEEVANKARWNPPLFAFPFHCVHEPDVTASVPQSRSFFLVSI